MKENFKKGECVEITGISSNYYDGREITSVGWIYEFKYEQVYSIIVAYLNDGAIRLNHFRSIKSIRKVNTMNKIIVDLYPVTKDAVLVSKYFGNKLDDPIFVLLLKGKEKELLEEANRLEQESMKK